MFQVPCFKSVIVSETWIDPVVVAVIDCVAIGWPHLHVVVA